MSVDGFRVCGHGWLEGWVLGDRYSYLEFGEGEPSAGAYAAVVFDTGTADDGSELVDWAGCNGYGFGMASVSTTELAAGLVGWINWVPVLWRS